MLWGKPMLAGEGIRMRDKHSLERSPQSPRGDPPTGWSYVADRTRLAVPDASQDQGATATARGPDSGPDPRGPGRDGGKGPTATAAYGPNPVAPDSPTSLFNGNGGGHPQPPLKLRGVQTRHIRGERRVLVLLIDSRPLTRDCISHRLEEGAREFRILPLSSPADLAADAECHGEAHLVVFNIGAAGISEPWVLEDIGLLNRTLPGVPVVVLSDREEIGHVVDALRHGVRGYIPTTLDFAVAVGALRLVQSGGTFVPASALVQSLQQKPPADGNLQEVERLTLAGFTPRQIEVLIHLRQGKSNKVIARELDMRESTAKVHVQHIMRKLNATNRTQAAFLAHRLFETLGHSPEARPPAKGER